MPYTRGWNYRMVKKQQTQRVAQGHDKLYRMGFDGAAIGTLRHLTRKQYEELLTILNEFHKDKTSAI